MEDYIINAAGTRRLTLQNVSITGQDAMELTRWTAIPRDVGVQVFVCMVAQFGDECCAELCDIGGSSAAVSQNTARDVQMSAGRNRY